VGTTIAARAVLLDMDGTLVDSTAVVERVWRGWALEHDLSPDDVIAVVHGRQGHESMALLLPARPVEENLAENRALLARETADTEGVVEVPGAAAFVAALAALPHALVTSADRALATARMGAAGIRMPSLAVTAEDVITGKPDPEGFLAAARRLGVAPADSVVFEDSPAGIAAARAAGMPVVGVGPRAGDADWTVPDLTGVRVRATADGIEIALHV
jgi:mannitol-1-/sugar-/sorbitol-6-phosphatase